MSPCEGEGSRCKSSREHQFHSSVAERKMHFFRKEDDAGATPAGGSNLLPTALRRSAVPGDDVASSIQACEACRVGASPTHLTNFVSDGASEPLGLQNRCDGSVTRGHVQFHSIQAEIALRSVGNGQKAGASPAGGSSLSQRRQVASHLAHNQKTAGSIPAAANFAAVRSTAPWSNSTTPLS